MRRGSRGSRPRTSRRRPWGRATVSRGNAGRAKKPAPVNSAAPYSPCLATTARGPIAITSRAARTQVRLPGEHAQLGVVHQHHVDAADRAHAASRGPSRSRGSSSRGPASCAPGHCSRTSRWRSGWMLARKSSVAPARDASDSCGAKSPKTLSWVSIGVGRVEVVLVMAAPEERAAALDVLDVVGDHAWRRSTSFSGVAEVVAHRADHAHVGEEARGQGEVHGGAAEHPLALPEGRLDRVEGDRADHDQAHAAGQR